MESMDYAARMRQQKKIQAACAKFAPKLSVGTRVVVTKDNGDQIQTIVRQAPWQTGSGDWLVSVDGISGGYSLQRVRLRMAGETWLLAIGSCIAVFVVVWMLAPKPSPTLCFSTDVEVATCRAMEMSARRELGEKLELIERQRLEIEELRRKVGAK